MAGNAESGGRRGSRWTLAFWGAAALILLTPLVAMQFTDEVAWTTFDFALAAGMLGTVGIGLELAFRNSRRPAYRLAAAIALAAGFLIVLVSGAVGIIGSEGFQGNLLFLGVPAVALVGALVARFRSAGMAWAMTAAALVQVLVPVAAWIAWPEARRLILEPEVPGSTVFFAAMWLLSASLFRNSATQNDDRAGKDGPTRRPFSAAPMFFASIVAAILLFAEARIVVADLHLAAARSALEAAGPAEKSLLVTYGFGGPHCRGDFVKVAFWQQGPAIPERQGYVCGGLFSPARLEIVPFSQGVIAGLDDH